jgi:hypothetical protein
MFPTARQLDQWPDYARRNARAGMNPEPPPSEPPPCRVPCSLATLPYSPPRGYLGTVALLPVPCTLYSVLGGLGGVCLSADDHPRRAPAAGPPGGRAIRGRAFLTRDTACSKLGPCTWDVPDRPNPARTQGIHPVPYRVLEVIQKEELAVGGDCSHDRPDSATLTFPKRSSLYGHPGCHLGAF